MQLSAGGGGGTWQADFQGNFSIDGGNRTITINNGSNSDARVSGNIVEDLTGNRTLTFNNIGGRKFVLAGAANAWTGGTTISGTGQFTEVAATSSLGGNAGGNVTVSPGGRLRLMAAGNLGSSASVDVQSSGTLLGVLALGYNGLPTITATSSGVLGIDTTGYNSITDLSTLGNGLMFLGSGGTGTFGGTSLTPAGDDIYRLGGGGGTLTIVNGVLVDGINARSLQVGSTLTNGTGTVVLPAANGFSGGTTINAGSTLTSRIGWNGTTPGSLGSGAVTLGGTLGFDTNSQTQSNNITLSANATITSGTLASLSGVVSSGTNTLTLGGLGILELRPASGTANTGSGLWSVTGGLAPVKVGTNVASAALPTTVGVSLDSATGSESALVLSNDFTWSDFTTGRSQYQAGAPTAGQWRLNGGGFAARGATQQVTSGNFDAGFRLGSSARDASGNYYADAAVDITQNIVLTGTRTIMLSGNGPWLDGLAGTVINRISGNISGTGALKVGGPASGPRRRAALKRCEHLDRFPGELPQRLLRRPGRTDEQRPARLELRHRGL